MDRILRTWTFWIRAGLREECRAYLEATKLPELAAQPGNLRASALFRDVGDGTTEVVVMSIWESMASIEAFTGRQSAAPTIDPMDRPKLFDHEPQVRHYFLRELDDAPPWLSRELDL
jgi:heme-degrading monooxygenase HmoA